MQHAEKNNILYPLQHGFRKGRSCETQLIEFVDDISKNLQEGRQTDILIMDFAKAFDKVNHSLLIHKLRYYGIDGKTTRWIQNWLEDR
jgi:retron-type reverse transcriptase